MIKQGDIILHDDKHYLVISHSCDISSEKEPNIELIQCLDFDGNAGNFTNGKNPRKYVFQFQERNVFVEASNKVVFDKSLINDADVISKHPDINCLQTWLSSRYKRQALPNVLNDLMKDELKIDKVVKDYGPELLGFWINYETEIMDSSDISDYEITMFAVFDNDNCLSEESIERFKRKIEDWDNRAKELNVTLFVQARYDLDVNYSDLRHMYKMCYDYYSPEDDNDL